MYVVPSINLNNFRISSEKNWVMLGFNPGAARWEISMLSIVLCGPHIRLSTHRDRQTDRQTERQKDRQTERQTDRQTDRE